MSSNTPPRLTGPTDDPERARRTNDRLTEQALAETDRFRVYSVTVVSGTDLVVRHDLRESLIPVVQPVGVGNIVQVVSYDFGRAVLRLTAGASAECLVKFERLTMPQPR